MATNAEFDAALVPRDPETGEPLAQAAQPGYYPGFSTMAQKAFWDEATRNVVTMRVEQPPKIRYFNAEQARFWRAVLDHLVPQYDRLPEKRIGLLEPIDERLYRDKTAGYRFENMPHDREAYGLGQQAIDEESAKRFGGAFADLPQKQQEEVLRAIHDRRPMAGRAIWKRMSIARFWQLLMQDAVESYYSHPWAWDEIGFGGPAYPRAYTRLERGEPEPWEVEERRYVWNAPDYAVSDVTETTHHLHLEVDQNG